MNRRKFLNAIGSAIIGTAIALNIPDSIVPRVEIQERRPEFIHDAFFVDTPYEKWFRNYVYFIGTDVRPTNN